MEIEVAKGQWIPLEEFFSGRKEQKGDKYRYNKKYLGLIEYFKQQLQLCHNVSIVNDNAIEFLGKIPQQRTGQPYLTTDEIFLGMKVRNSWNK